MQRVLPRQGRARERWRGPHHRAFPEPNERKDEILRLIAQRRSHHAIAELRTLSVTTAPNHVSNIAGKLQSADRASGQRVAAPACGDLYVELPRSPHHGGARGRRPAIVELAA